MVNLRCLGASHEVGRSAFLLSTDNNFLLDYGIKIFDESKHPKYPLPFTEDITAALISHSHLDHVGYVPHMYTFTNVPWYATPPTRDVAEIMFSDSMKIMGDKLPYNHNNYRKALMSWKPTFYGKEIKFGDTRVTYHDAGHIIGSSMIDIKYKNKKILYTGDFKIGETRMHKGAEYQEDVDALIIEGTYALREHPDRKELENQFIEEIIETIDNGGNVLLPAFALGRSQELISILGSHDFGVPIFLDGMSKAITEIYLKYPYYLKDFDEFSKAVDSVTFVNSSRSRRDATDQQSIIITTAGMMEGGPVLSYLGKVNPNSKIIFSGYNVEGTNGWRLLNTGKILKDGYELDVSLSVKYYDFSAHVGRSDELEFIKKANPSKVVVVHSDSDVADKYSKELRDDLGFDAVAPNPSDLVELV